MAIVLFQEIDQRETEFGARDDSRAKRSWRVVTNNRYDREQAIKTYGIANGILPTRFQPHPDNLYLTARRLRCVNQSDSPLHWIVEAEYSSEPVKESEREKESQPNPLLRPAKIRWVTNRYQKAVIKAKANVEYIDASDTVLQTASGKAIVNSAGEYFDPPLEVEKSHWNITISKNVDSVPDWVLDIDNPINSSSCTIGGKTFPRKKLKLQEKEISELQEENDVEFYVLTLQIEYRKDGWDLIALDQGLRQISGGSRVNITDANGRAVTSPWPLDGLGAKLTAPTPANACYMRAQVYETFDFNNFPLT